MKLSEATKKHIDHWVKKFPEGRQRSAVVEALLVAQQQNGGWLSEPAMDAVAHHLKLERIEVYEIATFYDMFELAVVGRHKIAVCTNVSCMLRDSEDILRAIKDRLGIDPGETTTDGKFFIREVECLGACVGAPMCQINDKEYYENLTPESMIALIDKLDKEQYHEA